MFYKVLVVSVVVGAGLGVVIGSQRKSSSDRGNESAAGSDVVTTDAGVVATGSPIGGSNDAPHLTNGEANRSGKIPSNNPRASSIDPVAELLGLVTEEASLRVQRQTEADLDKRTQLDRKQEELANRRFFIYDRTLHETALNSRNSED